MGFICPMTNITHECDKEDCAWYDKEDEQCDLKSIRQALERIAKALEGRIKVSSAQ